MPDAAPRIGKKIHEINKFCGIAGAGTRMPGKKILRPIFTFT